MTDSSGAQDSTFVDIRPNVVRVTSTTEPGGLDLTLDGQPVGTPSVDATVTAVYRKKARR